MESDFYVSVKERSQSNVTDLLSINRHGSRSEFDLKSKIHEFRTHYALTLRELSRLCGVPVNTLWRMEKGYGAKLANAFKVADAFQVTIYEMWHLPASSARKKARGPSGPASVRELRAKHGWRLEDLSRLCGVSKTTLAAIENGRVPTLKSAVQIAATFGVSLYQIWGGVDGTD